jgi:hypothetical protein
VAGNVEATTSSMPLPMPSPEPAAKTQATQLMQQIFAVRAQMETESERLRAQMETESERLGDDYSIASDTLERERKLYMEICLQKTNEWKWELTQILSDATDHLGVLDKRLQAVKKVADEAISSLESEQSGSAERTRALIAPLERQQAFYSTLDPAEIQALLRRVQVRTVGSGQHGGCATLNEHSCVDSWGSEYENDHTHFPMNGLCCRVKSSWDWESVYEGSCTRDLAGLRRPATKFSARHILSMQARLMQRKKVALEMS